MRHARRHALGIATVACALFTTACNARVTQGGDTGGEGGDAGDTGGAQAELAQACSDGCAAFVVCFPEGYEMLYPDDDCEATCLDLYDECAAEAVDYATCTTGLECAAWPDLIEDPDLTECGDAWSAVASCHSITPEPDP